MWSITRNSIISLIFFVLLLDLSLFLDSTNATPLGRSQGGYGQRSGRKYGRPTTTRGQQPTTSSSSLPSTSATQDPATPSTTATTNPTPTGNTAFTSATLPSNGGGLPAPSSSLRLKAVVIGRGTQNYTCSNGSPAPGSQGALAQLYDGTSLLPSQQDELNRETINSLSNTPSNLPEIGSHYFNGAKVPTFDLLSSTGLLFVGGKLANVPAPSDANQGLTNEGAVDWLQLGDNGQSVGVKEVYRVETAGGKPPVDCTGREGEVLVKYATQYWFYG